MTAKQTDHVLRERLRGWVRHHLEERRDIYPNDGDFAERVGMKPETLSQILSGSKTMGLDVLVRFHRAMNRSLDVLVNEDPPDTKKIGRPKQPASHTGGAAAGDSTHGSELLAKKKTS